MIKCASHPTSFHAGFAGFFDIVLVGMATVIVVGIIVYEEFDDD
ncbi:MAG: hypothetical protein OXI96_09935 [Acidimicrobiaceae bacterium]|nr:hypothetical protein [Acidimicrobiaceae bacterium]